jgi:hypothetical protein
VPPPPAPLLRLCAARKQYQAELVREARYWRRHRFDEDILDKLFATLRSYFGHSLMANTYNLWRSI